MPDKRLNLSADERVERHIDLYYGTVPPFAIMGRMYLTNTRLVWLPIRYPAAFLPFLFPAEVEVDRNDIRAVTRASWVRNLLSNLGVIRGIDIELVGGTVIRFRTPAPGSALAVLNQWLEDQQP